MAGYTIDLTDVDDSAKVPLGFKVVEPAESGGDDQDKGERVWIYVFNDDAAVDWEQGDVIIRDAGTETYDGIQASGAVAAARVIGVAQHAIAAGKYGFVLREGIGEVKGDGGDDQDDVGLTPVASGRATAVAAATTDAFGLGLEGDGGAADGLFTARLACRG